MSDLIWAFLAGVVSAYFILPWVYCLFRAVILAIGDTMHFIIYSEVKDGYSPWDKLWILPPILHRVFRVMFKENFYWSHLHFY